MKATPKRTAEAIALLAWLTALAAVPFVFRPTAAETEETDTKQGYFVRSYWYERGIEHGNPFFDGRFRVNAPEAVLHPSFMHRREVRENGMMLIRIEEDLTKLSGAELYLELWGGHPGTANKRLTINGRSTYAIPEVGTAQANCTHSYPTFPLKITDLLNGYNAIQFACDEGSSFWGHFIVDNASLRTILKNDHPDLQSAGLSNFEAAVVALPITQKREVIPIELKLAAPLHEKVSSVHFIGHYEGYDENGNGKSTDWHGFSKNRLPYAILGTATTPPFSIEWEVSMLGAQKDVSVKAIVHFKEHPETAYVTPVLSGLSIPDRKESSVRFYASKDLPHAFWSRAWQAKECSIVIEEEPERIERAELHVVIWDGGRGNVENPFTLNGHPLPVAGDGHHDVLYRKLALDPKLLNRGVNRIRLLSDTEHHGVEVLLPGPAIMVRSRRQES